MSDRGSDRGADRRATTSAAPNGVGPAGVAPTGVGDARFDPRFDPAFQPGYDGTADRPRRPVAPVQRIEHRPSPSVRPPEPVSDVQAPAGPVGPTGPLASQATIAEAPDDPPPATGTNPFIVALWALSAVFLLGGLALIQWLPSLEAQLQLGGDEAIPYTLFQVIFTTAPMLIMLALATATGLLFVSALRWRRA